ncbi:MAG: hypothetical protein AAFZ07_19680 [Actinomycetota bacterium]
MSNSEPEGPEDREGHHIAARRKPTDRELELFERSKTEGGHHVLAFLFLTTAFLLGVWAVAVVLELLGQALGAEALFAWTLTLGCVFTIAFAIWIVGWVKHGANAEPVGELAWGPTEVAKSETEAKQMAATIRKMKRRSELTQVVVWGVGSFLVGLLLASLTRDPRSVLLSRSGAAAGVWHAVDTLPLVELPSTWSWAEPSIESSPTAFRLSISAIRASMILGALATLTYVINPRPRATKG